jgi:hypothetical protein
VAHLKHGLASIAFVNFNDWLGSDWLDLISQRLFPLALVSTGFFDEEQGFAIDPSRIALIRAFYSHLVHEEVPIALIEGIEATSTSMYIGFIFKYLCNNYFT